MIKISQADWDKVFGRRRGKKAPVATTAKKKPARKKKPAVKKKAVKKKAVKKKAVKKKPARKKAPAKKKPARKKKVASKEAAPKRIDRLKGGGVLDHDRPFLVVEVEPGKTRAFYMSTGTGGETRRGEWVGFAGIREDGWFIKAVGGKRIPKYAWVTRAIAERYGSDPERAMRKIVSQGGGAFQSSREGAKVLNRYLAYLGAVPAHGGGFTEDIAVMARGAHTFIPSPRGEFNPRSAYSHVRVAEFLGSSR